jgi:peptide-methionine (R)-S-oxide reductase
MAETDIPDDEDAWKQRLSQEEYHVLREKGTEPPGSGEYIEHDEDGTYHCAGCGQELFHSDTKFEAGHGWPSFWDTIDEDCIELREDTSHGMNRTEVVCARCSGHLGHVFEDGPDPSGKRFCINSVALEFNSNDDR